MTSHEYPLYNAYIWEYIASPWVSWEPSSSTLLYAPFTNDLVDHSPSSTTMTKNGTVTNTTLNWVKCAYFNGWYIDVNLYTQTNVTHTISLWFYTTTNNDSWWIICSNPCWIMQWEAIAPNSSTIRYLSFWSEWWITASWSYTWQWFNVILTWWKMYVNNTYIWEKTTAPNWASYKYSICNHASWSSCSRRVRYWYVWEVIIENVVWSDEIRNAYYNQTKWNYWIS